VQVSDFLCRGVEGTDLDDCIKALATALHIDALALGFEAPQFVPFREDQLKLTQARQVDRRIPDKIMRAL
jgi:hypothetical protein